MREEVRVAILKSLCMRDAAGSNYRLRKSHSLMGIVITTNEKEAVRVAVEYAHGVKGVRDNVHALALDEHAYHDAV